MREVVEYDLNFRKKGKDGIKKLRVDFISKFVVDTWQLVISDMQKVQTLSDERMSLYQANIDNITKQLENYKEVNKENKKRIKEIEEEIIAIGEKLLDRRFNIIQIILEDNNVDDEDLKSVEFWSRCVEPDVEIDFINAVVYKDYGKKKAGIK